MMAAAPARHSGAVELTRLTVTAASRVMLPTYAVLFTVIGLNYATLTSRLGASAVLSYADAVLPIRAWGLLFLGCACVMTVALVWQDRVWFRFALWLGIISLTLWSGTFLAAAVWANASYSAWVWPAFAAVACFASDRSLLKGEVS